MKSTTMLKLAKDLKLCKTLLDGVFHEANEVTLELDRVSKELYDEGIKARKYELNARYGDKYSDYKDELSPQREIIRIFGVNSNELAEAVSKLYEIRNKRGSEYMVAYTASREDTGHIVAGATPEFQLNIAIGIIEYFKNKGYIKVIEQALKDVINDEPSE